MSIRGGDARDLIEEYGARCGWNDDSKIDLLCDYINNQKDGACLDDFLLQQVEEEESYSLDDEDVEDEEEDEENDDDSN